MLNGLDLFSGIGGLTIALAPWVRPVAYCEADRYATAVLLSQMERGNIRAAPIWDDVRTLKGNMLPEIDIIYGGFPCQDVSTAGLRKGLDGERTGLFREAVRLVSECKPKFVFLENVPGIRKYVPTVRQELEALGYDCRDGFLSAAEVGALHIRNRWWLLAYSTKQRGTKDTNQRQEHKQKGARMESVTFSDGETPIMADTNKQKPDGLSIGKASQIALIGQPSWWATEPDVGRVANGISFRVDRLRGLGNAVVPAQAREAFKRLSGLSLVNQLE